MFIQALAPRSCARKTGGSLPASGNYVADIKRPDMAMGVFLRSPHAHALIKGIDIRLRPTLPGVAAIFTGADLAADKVGGLPCAWGVSNADGTPMKEPPRSAMAVDKVRWLATRWRSWSPTRSNRRAKLRTRSRSTMRSCRPSSACSTLYARRAAVFDDMPDNTCFDWECGDGQGDGGGIQECRSCRQASAW